MMQWMGEHLKGEYLKFLWSGRQLEFENEGHWMAWLHESQQQVWNGADLEQHQVAYMCALDLMPADENHSDHRVCVAVTRLLIGAVSFATGRRWAKNPVPLIHNYLWTTHWRFHAGNR
mmetsp:Transcript_6534/g.15110  ORF Transcript_6534/g.15110 Transcript_6534/m.15110 type:complete len:118 (-) Transcript_6534:69-422(-)